MSRGKIVICEGTSCAGKTTFCSNLAKQKNWYLIPEAVRYLERETRKSGDEASPIPNEIEEELFFQQEFLRVEKRRIEEANDVAHSGHNVILDKSFLAVVATAYGFAKLKKFSGTYERALELYYKNYLPFLVENGFVECDKFILLTAEHPTIIERNQSRGHILHGIWVDKALIELQKEFLVNNLPANSCEIHILDTTSLDTGEVKKDLMHFINR